MATVDLRSQLEYFAAGRRARHEEALPRCLKKGQATTNKGKVASKLGRTILKSLFVLETTFTFRKSFTDLKKSIQGLKESKELMKLAEDPDDKAALKQVKKFFMKQTFREVVGLAMKVSLVATLVMGFAVIPNYPFFAAMTVATGLAVLLGLHELRGMKTKTNAKKALMELYMRDMGRNYNPEVQEGDEDAIFGINGFANFLDM